MSTRKRVKANKNYKQIWKLSSAALKRLINWLLRSLLVMGRRARLSRSGFVMPTVAMVLLVVMLLTTAILIRSFDRSKNASNVRVNQAVLNAAAPALDRARAKINALFTDPTLPRATPADSALYNALRSSKYNLGGETRLKLVLDINNNGTIQRQPDPTRYVLENDETLTNAWKFPVDTDNNGKFDSYTLYGIYFRSPRRNASGQFDRPRNPLEARTPPMSGNISEQCANETGTSTSLTGDSSWYRTGTKLTKSFFVYTTTVPITNLSTIATSEIDNYEVYIGNNRGFSALEFQQDRSQIPLTNNAALFQDDLELSPGSAFRLNGRVFTNANLLIGGHGSGGTIRLYQVSSKNSCFYKEENSKITVGGNVGTGNVADTTDQTAVTVDLFNGAGNDPDSATINGSNRSTTSQGGAQVAYNDAAYNRRIALMKPMALSYSTTNPPTVASVSAVSQYPQQVKDGFRAKIEGTGGSSLNAQAVLADQIEIYLKDRTRRVPYAEVSTPDGSIGTCTSTNFVASGIIEPCAPWREPTDTNTSLTLTTANLAQTQPEKQRRDAKETYLGDRVYVGNNLPAYWKNGSTYVTGLYEKQFLGSTIKWTAPNTELRYRTTQVIALPDVGISGRDGFWEDAAAQQPLTNSSNIGGLRVITGAGIYVDDDRSATVGTASYPRSTKSFLPPPALDSGVSTPIVFTTTSISTGNENIVVWPDSMPMTGGAAEIAGANKKGDLQMRATAIYHYKDSSYTDTNYINRTPTACVSSYYDPTNATTARNSLNAWLANYDVNGRSNNGIVYPNPYTSATDSARVTAISSYRTQLNRQARLVFPNGRIVNQPLRNALAKIDASGTRSLADNAAIDTGICAIRILSDATFLPSATPVLPPGAIKEASFLDPRQVKANDRTASNYDLELEQRQPLEVRVIDINIRQLATTTIGSSTRQEYLLPNSGIIYASRDDALLDLSDTTAEKELLSPTDFRLDPTRRPNGIRLINGSNLARNNNFREEEKGLILVTNLPAYIQGSFNLHQKPGTSTPTEEFEEDLATSDWGNFYSRNSTRDDNFACRIGQPGCGSNGDQWRPATIISDAITPLSTQFVDGFRNQGDYDLSNNAGSSAIQARKKNGFFDNSFIPSALWWDTGNTDNAYPYEKTTNRYVGSYLTNAVTPVQRRTDSPEYLMEYCPKIPVSECKTSDWVINTSGAKATAAIGQTFAIGTHQAGTTAQAASLNLERYARRVAFKRKTNGTLELTQWASPNDAQATPIPLGINSAGKVAEFPYTNGSTIPPYTSSTIPRQADNALWFRTTTNTNGKPYENASYENNKPLAYTGDTQLISPPTPEIPGVPSLNLPVGNPASSYTICTKNDGYFKKYEFKNTISLDTAAGGCGNGTAPFTQIEAAFTGFNALNPATSLTDNIVTPIRTNASGVVVTGTFPTAATVGTITTFTNNPPALPQPGYIVNIIQISSDFDVNNNDTIIKLVGDENSIFVLKNSGSVLKFGSTSGCSSCHGVQLTLDGVDPNNVFWVTDSNLQFNNVNSTYPHKLAGTILNKGAAGPKLNNLIIEGGRYLGANGVPSSGTNFSNDTRIYAIASSGQPFLVPVLQIHSPEGSPSSGSSPATDGILINQWLQRVTADVTINAVFVSGNSPSRPAEESAGLHNFVRFVETWNAGGTRRTLNIKGGFIQFKRSAYATGPFSTILAAKADDNDGSLSIFGYPFTRYKTDNGTPSGTLPYYEAPTRQWGFDVGILSQPPDLFAERFTQQPVAPPDEFFREVSRDDAWIQSLLCAAQGSGTSYTYAIDSSELPNCPFNPSSSTAYND